MLIGLLYGYQISGVVPGEKTVSWQAHLFGLAGGLLAAILFRRKRPKPDPVADTPDLPATLTFPPTTEV